MRRLRCSIRRARATTNRGIDREMARKRPSFSMRSPPRFAATSSPEQMEMAGALWKESPGTFLQSHVSENEREVAWIRALYPERNGYLDVYDHYGQLGPRAVYAHGVHLTEGELARCHATDTAIAHCPTSKLLPRQRVSRCLQTSAPRPARARRARDRYRRAGTSFSPLQTMNEAYKAAQLPRQRAECMARVCILRREARRMRFISTIRSARSRRASTRCRRARSALDAADRLSHALLREHRGSVVRADDARRRSCDARDVHRRRMRLRSRARDRRIGSDFSGAPRGRACQRLNLGLHRGIVSVSFFSRERVCAISGFAVLILVVCCAGAMPNRSKRNSAGHRVRACQRRADGRESRAARPERASSRTAAISAIGPDIAIPKNARR